MAPEEPSTQSVIKPTEKEIRGLTEQLVHLDDLQDTVTDQPQPPSHAHADFTKRSPGPKSMSEKMREKQMKKRQRQRNERVKVLEKLGLPQEQIAQVLAQEDYSNAPIDEKLRRLEAMVSRGLHNLAQEMINLRHNDGVIADAMDVNLRAMAKCLELVGVPKEKQGELIKQAHEEIKREREEEEALRNQAQEAAQKAADAKNEQPKSEQEEVAELQKAVDAEGEPSQAPTEATTFGG